MIHVSTGTSLFHPDPSTKKEKRKEKNERDDKVSCSADSRVY
jgi:hypothetical protein